MSTDNNTARTPGAPARRKRWHRALVIVAMPLLIAALLWTTQAAPAKEVVGAFRLRRPAVLQTTPPDPVRFLNELELVMPKPTVPLTVGDAVAQELMFQSHSLSERDALRTANALVEESSAVGYDPLLVLALIYVESDYNHFAISPVGAEGLMQIMPDTGEWMARQMGLERNQGHTFDPVLNVRLGTRYLAQLQRQFGGSLELALTAYNRGPSNTRYLLRRFGRLPDSVHEVYAGKVLKRYRDLRASYGALPLG
jgi:soluble lytic murein transglycosylase-like protein